MILDENSFLIRYHRKIGTIAIVALFGFSCSCITQRDLEYLKDKNKNIRTFKEVEFPDYKLKPNDELYIQVKSLDEEAANLIPYTRQQYLDIGTMQPYGASMLSYTVDKDGYLLLPILGKIFVMNKTVSDVATVIQNDLKHILNQPTVTVKLVNRYVSVLGEVQNPGHYIYSQDKLTIYDAIGLAGDITVYGNRKQVILVRNENGENIRINVNLKESDILASDYYLIRPNDLIYIKPLRKRFWGFSQFPFDLILSTFTLGLLIYSVID